VQATEAEQSVASLIQAIHGGVHADRAMDTMRAVYSTDRWFTFPKFEETAAYLKRRLEESGLTSVEIGGADADGHTQAGFWTMPLAWDVKQARLEMVEPEYVVLCDYQEVPASLGMWSGPTPKGGITTEIVDILRTPWTAVKGKLVLTDKNSADYKYELVKYGALGAVNGWSESPALQNGRQWINAWGDNGWGFTKTSTPLLSYSVTPQQAGHIRALLAQGKRVVVHAVADTRYYAGRYPWVTGVLPGVDPGEEVLVLGHTSEQGAQDNATGVSAMVESLATIARLVKEGTLPRPQRSIRVLLMSELYGSLTYIRTHANRMKHTIAAMTVDTPAASYDLAGTEYTFYANPQVAMSYSDALIIKIAGSYFASRRPWHRTEHMPGTDSYLGEPEIGVPDVWSYTGVNGFVRWLTVDPGPDPWFHLAGGSETLVYPGERFHIAGPLASIRLKLQRNCLQDLALLDAQCRRDSRERLQQEVTRRFNNTNFSDWSNANPKLPAKPIIDWNNADIGDALKHYEARFAHLEPSAWLRVHEFVLEEAQRNQ
jgi:hypothetical protein